MTLPDHTTTKSRATDDLPVFSAADLAKSAAERRRPWHDHYYAMYSSLLGGIVTDPLLMQVPADDHVVHRGDGVFESVKCLDGALYALEPHVARLARSAAALGLALPREPEDLCRVACQTVKAGGHRDALLRILASRGPGGFDVRPSECPAPALYLVAYRLPPPFTSLFPEGASAIRSRLPVKPACMATVKSCNYLLNALMRQEADTAGAAFALGFDEDGRLAEGATENIGIVTRSGELRVPRPGRVLEGITVARALALAGPLVASGLLRNAGRGDIRETDIREAAEMLVFGTTRDVGAITRYEGCPVGDGRPGPVQAALLDLLREDLRTSAVLRTAVFP